MYFTPKKIKIIDIFVIFLFMISFIQFGYFLIAGNYPLNALLTGIFAPIGTATITSNNFLILFWDIYLNFFILILMLKNI